MMTSNTSSFIFNKRLFINTPLPFDGESFDLWKTRMIFFIEADDFDLWNLVIND